MNYQKNVIGLCWTFIVYINGCLSYPHVTCDETFHKIGCFKSTKYERQLLITDRDVTSKHFTGFVLQWGELAASLHSLICRCSQKARREGYKHVAIRFFAECWGYKDVDTVDLLMRVERSRRCIEDRNSICTKSNECTGVGDEHSEYIYSIIQSVKTSNVDGGYSAWSDWTDCSKTCGSGVQERERLCNNPIPSGEEGAKCKGPSTEVKECKIRECPGIGDSTGKPECEQSIKGLYLATLYRNPDDEGFKYHLNNCKKGEQFYLTCYKFFGSKERKKTLCTEDVKNLYKNVLKKAPDALSLDHIDSCIKNDDWESYISLVMKFIQSEYLKKVIDLEKYPTKCHQRTIGIYRALLGSEDPLPDNFGEIFEGCNDGFSLRSQIRGESRTQERKNYKCRVRVNKLFNYVLQRRGEPGEVEYHVKRCLAGRTLCKQTHDFVYSQEFKGRYRTLEPKVTSIIEI